MHAWQRDGELTDATGTGAVRGPAGALRRAATTLQKLASSLADEADLLGTDRPAPVARRAAAAGAESGPSGAGGPGFEYVYGFPAITEAIRRTLDGATTEILTAQPDGPRPGPVLDDALEAVRASLESGVGMRTLYQHSTRFDEPTKEYVRAVAGYGAQVRTLAEFFDRLIIVDRKVAFLPANSERSTVVVVSEPAVVRFLVDVFERAWDRAEPYPFLPVRAAEAAVEIVPAMRDAICRLLFDGRSDREIARRLGFSLRSLQSHVARLKDQYGAQHRFQLGYLMGIEEATQGGPLPIRHRPAALPPAAAPEEPPGPTPNRLAGTNPHP